MLVADRPVAVFPAPVIDRGHCTGKPTLGRTCRTMFLPFGDRPQTTPVLVSSGRISMLDQMYRGGEPGCPSPPHRSELARFGHTAPTLGVLTASASFGLPQASAGQPSNANQASGR
jgi:hypothetical protein